MITAVGGYVPKDVLSNADLEKLVDTNDEWIRTRTGISERRILRGEGLGTSDMALEAAKIVLAKRGIEASDLDMIIVATTTPDHVFPSTANILADKLGAGDCFGFDLQAACSGFLFALTTASKFVESGSHKKVLVVGGDKMSSIVNYEDRATCIIFGDGAGAVLLEPTEEDGIGIMDADLHSDGVGRTFLNMKAGGSAYPATAETVAAKEHYVFQEGAPVFKAAVKGMPESVKILLDRNELAVNDITWLVPHQANKRIIDGVGNYLGIDPERVCINIQKYGNTTSGTIPLCLWEWENQFKKGDNIMLTAFGGGFTWGSVWIRWGYNS